MISEIVNFDNNGSIKAERRNYTIKIIFPLYCKVFYRIISSYLSQSQFFKKYSYCFLPPCTRCVPNVKKKLLQLNWSLPTVKYSVHYACSRLVLAFHPAAAIYFYFPIAYLKNWLKIGVAVLKSVSWSRECVYVGGIKESVDGGERE